MSGFVRACVKPATEMRCLIHVRGGQLVGVWGTQRAIDGPSE